ncbi:hypothetical protein SAMN05216466_107151 [Paraburkholderia phenazinium]|uniref:Uncharacterized protein n=1 Tax=Paraburkholderia phenazinium TaxID=60549 RepID=A0A1G7ZTJ8_9BURK|nr:hypothetical protein [Paraburkholderia phenazinium]SDH11490.1 hypothetical protein SAMN05216466_107151 [Paraburkholderia phenazinium]
MTADQIKALAAILREDARWVGKQYSSHIEDRIENAADALEALSLENQRLRVDAERYRMIRNRSDYWRQHGRQAVMLGMFEEFLDAVIDAARSQSEEGKQ